ncbi:MAG: sulfite exporter TauE/SafE family protein [Actinomycetota bacterium]|nr:sulfite exporter TauE/SafE family protein [Actinomycetota bacterium]
MILRWLAFMGSGMLAGVFSGGLGVGGGIVATPLIRFLGVSAYLAIGTTVPAILPSAITGTFRYTRSGLIDKRVVAFVAPGAVVTTIAGALATRHFNGHVLMLITAFTLLVLALRTLPSKRPIDDTLDVSPNPLGLVLLGIVTGAMSGLLGVGGGFLMVPVFTRVFKMKVKTAIGTSLAVISVIVTPNLIAQSYVGNIDWKVAALLAMGVIPGAWLGAGLAIRAPEQKLRVVVGVALAIVAVAYGAFELRALLSA